MPRERSPFDFMLEINQKLVKLCVKVYRAQESILPLVAKNLIEKQSRNSVLQHRSHIFNRKYTK